MIERRTFWFACTAALLMVAATVWRLSLLSDWTRMPAAGAANPHVINGLMLFVAPACVVVLLLILRAVRFSSPSEPAEVESWHHWGSSIVVPYCLICAALEAVVIARSLGVAAALDPHMVVRFFFVLMGALIVYVGNRLPKLPPLQSRIAFFRLDAWQRARSNRFAGKATILTGIAIIASQVLPVPQITPAVFFIVFTYFAVIFWKLFRLRREAST